MVDVFVNDVSVSVPNGSTVLQACEKSGAVVPRFCQHDRLLVAGNCRMCLVEVAKSPKPVVACAIPVMGGIEIFTESPLAQKAREGVLEFLLLNHPLDCPICDQGGECDLQDQTLAQGGDQSRFFGVFKRGVEDKDCGPLIQTIITRCIACSRCIRFSSEIAGFSSLGMTSRGSSTEVGTFVPIILQSEVSGNLVDLCPVGALTSKPQSFKARPWELASVDSVDTMDSIGSNIRQQIAGNSVLRILPVKNDEVNEDWITDKTRFCLDSFSEISLGISTVDEKLLFSLSKNILSSSVKPQFFIGPQVGLKGVQKVSSFCSRFELDKPVHSQVDPGFCTDFETSFLFNTKLSGTDAVDCFFFVGTNLKQELPLLNARLRSAFLRDSAEFVHVGQSQEFDSFPVKSLGITFSDLKSFFQGKHLFCKEWSKCSNPKLVFSSTAFFEISSNKKLFGDFQSFLQVSKKPFSFQDVLFFDASSVGFCMLLGSSRKPSLPKGSKISLVFVGLDPKEDLKGLLLGKLFSSIAVGNKFFSLNFSSFTSFVKNNFEGFQPISKDVADFFINLEGRVQQTLPVFEENKNTGLDSFLNLSVFSKQGFSSGNSFSCKTSLIEPQDWVTVFSSQFVFGLNRADSLFLSNLQYRFSGSGVQLEKQVPKRSLFDFWSTDPISRRSKTLAKAS